jgi:hypothetical protein
MTQNVRNFVCWIVGGIRGSIPQQVVCAVREGRSFLYVLAVVTQQQAQECSPICIYLVAVALA